MGVTAISFEMDTEQMRKIFGMQDAYIKKLEQDFQVTIVDRNGSVVITGEEENASKASRVLKQLTALSDHGNEIEEQSVDYAIEMGKEDQEDKLMEMDADCICHTISGKPIKPKTLGQKAYVDAIRKNMIVFGLGPAGTGKTYLAMAMAITAFKNNEVSRIILTRPAIEAGEKLGFLPGDLQSKVDPYLRPLYDALYQIMGAESFAKNMEKVLCFLHVIPLQCLKCSVIILQELVVIRILCPCEPGKIHLFSGFAFMYHIVHELRWESLAECPRIFHNVDLLIQQLPDIGRKLKMLHQKT